MTDKSCKIEFPDGSTVQFPVLEGTEQEKAIDISKLRAKTGYITSDSGYGNTGSCHSKITFIDGEQGILRYRGIPIEQMAEKSNFVEAAYLIIYGELPNKQQYNTFSGLLTEYELIHEDFHHHFNGFPNNAPPMAILGAMINALSCYHPYLLNDESSFEVAASMLISKVRTITAFAHKKSIGQPIIYPDPNLKYSENLLHMMFSLPNKDYDLKPAVVRALDMIFVLHADHEQNCSTSTVRMVGSSKAGLFASVSAGVSALWGPLHGGANMAVIKMLDDINKSGMSFDEVLAKVKDKDSDFKLMGFGHRVYKNFDPRARIMKKACDEVFNTLGIQDPLLDLAKKLEEAALNDDYFIERKLYPNVDFYSGIVMKAIGIPVEMFTVMFAIGRMPGWIANWKEVRESNARIYRPRQIYVGPNQRDYVDINQR